MKVKMRKQKYSFIAIVLILLCLVGCGETDKEKDTSTNTSTMSDATLTDATPEDAIPMERKDYDTIAESDWLVKDNLVEGTDNLYEVVVPEIADTYGTVVDMAAAGDNVIVLYSDKDKNSYLYEIEPYNMYVVRETELPAGKYDDCSIMLYDDELYVFETESSIAIFYDYQFEKQREITLPHIPKTKLIKTSNSKSIYYLEEESSNVIKVDLITGVEDVIFENLSVGDRDANLLGILGDEYVFIFGGFRDGKPIYEARDGISKEVISSGEPNVSRVESIGDSYAVSATIDGYEHVFCGDTSEDDVDVICFRDDYSYSLGELEKDTTSKYRMLVTEDLYSEFMWKSSYGNKTAEAYMSLIDINTGETNIVKYSLIDDEYRFNTLTDVVFLEEENMVIFSVYNVHNKIYIWDLDKCDDNSNQIISVFDYEDMEHFDDDTYEYLMERAKTVGTKYNVKILFGDDVDPNMCNLANKNYNAVMINLAINSVEEEYCKYPEGMLAQIDDGYGGVIEISLMGEFYDDFDGHQYTALGKTSLAIEINCGDFPTMLHHETFHAIENHVAYVDGTFDTEEWHSMNPEGFQYDYSYDLVMASNHHEYTGEYFMYQYGKSYPSEDRAIIMQSAMTNNTTMNQYLRREPLNAKLDYISKKVRKGFDTTGWPEVTYWEERLN